MVSQVRRDIGGDGKLTGVFVGLGRAFLARPFTYLAMCGICGLPLTLLSMQRSNNWPAIMMGLIILVSVSLMSGLSLAVASREPPERLVRADFISGLRGSGIFLCVFGMEYAALYAWVQLLVSVQSVSAGYTPLVFGVFGLGLIGLLFLVPAYLWLVPPVFTLETGTLAQKWQRARLLPRGYRPQIFGAFLVVSLVGVIGLTLMGVAIVASVHSAGGAGATNLITAAILMLLWCALGILSAVLYQRIRHARGELDVPDVADIFA